MVTHRLCHLLTPHFSESVKSPRALDDPTDTYAQQSLWQNKQWAPSTLRLVDASPYYSNAIAHQASCPWPCINSAPFELQRPFISTTLRLIGVWPKGHVNSHPGPSVPVIQSEPFSVAPASNLSPQTCWLSNNSRVLMKVPSGDGTGPKPLFMFLSHGWTTRPRVFQGRAGWTNRCAITVSRSPCAGWTDTGSSKANMEESECVCFFLFGCNYFARLGMVVTIWAIIRHKYWAG